MNFRKLHLNTIYLLAFFALAVNSCDKKQVDYTARKAKQIPEMYTLATNTAFHFEQDTLYFNAKKFSGKQYLLYANKDTAFVKLYLNGLLEGTQKQWYPDGKLAEERLYVSNKKEGEHKGWWGNGKPKYTYQFFNDEYQGEVQEWYFSGQLFKRFHYVKGQEEGSERLWFEDGSVRANYVIKKGKKYGLIGIKLCKNPYEKIIK